VVQELEIRPRVIRYRRERWLTPDGRTVIAPLPAGISGHFGPNLRRFVLAQCHQGQVTVPRLVAQLRDFGLAVSKRQVVRLLTVKQEPFLDEARDVLRAGLTSAEWLTADDTGARHKACPGEGRGRRTASARRAAMTASSGSARPRPRAGATFSNCCAPVTKIT
jgi:Transposase IS66 family